MLVSSFQIPRTGLVQDTVQERGLPPPQRLGEVRKPGKLGCLVVRRAGEPCRTERSQKPTTLPSPWPHHPHDPTSSTHPVLSHPSCPLPLFRSCCSFSITSDGHTLLGLGFQVLVGGDLTWHISTLWYRAFYCWLPHQASFCCMLARLHHDKCRSASNSGG